MEIEIWQWAVIFAACVGGVWVITRVAANAWFKSKREHTKALLREMDVKDSSNP